MTYLYLSPNCQILMSLMSENATEQILLQEQLQVRRRTTKPTILIGYGSNNHFSNIESKESQNRIHSSSIPTWRNSQIIEASKIIRHSVFRSVDEPDKVSTYSIGQEYDGS